MANVVNYKPPYTVGRFIKSYLPGVFFQRWIIGPVGSGKTTGIFFKLVRMAALQEPSPVDGKRYVRAVIVRNTMPQLKDTTLVSWNYWFKEGIAGDWNATDKIFTLKYNDCVVEVLFRPLDTPDDVRRCLSLEVTFAIFDEFVEINQEIIRAMKARCGRYPPALHGGATNFGMWGSSNPGNEDDWWYQYLRIENPEERPFSMKYFEQPSGFSDEAENTENLPNGYYENLAETEDEETGEKPSEAWVKRFIEVQWGFSNAGKPVVPTFRRNIHRSDTPLRPIRGLPLLIGYDPGVGGSALIIGQQDLDGRLLIYDELIQRGYGTERLVTDRLIPLLNTSYPGYEVLIYPDPAADSRTSTDERTSVDVLKKLARTPGNPDRKRWTIMFPTMDNRLQGRLDGIEHFTTRLTSAGPALMIDPRCKGLLRALGGGWRYPTDTKGKTVDSPEKNEHSHPGDALSYLARACQLGRTKGRSRTQILNQRTYVNQYATR